MADPTDISPKGFLRRFRDLVEDLGACEEMTLEDSVRLGSGKVRLPGPLPPMQILLGGEVGKRLQLQPEVTLNAKGKVTEKGSYLLFDPDRFFSGIHGFLRLRPSDSVRLGREDPRQAEILDYPATVADRHLNIKLTENGLVLKDRAPGHGTCVSPLNGTAERTRMARWRREKLARLARLLPVPLAPLPREEALELIEAVLDQMEREPRQAKDEDGGCGGLVELPGEMNVFFVGDLHARIDNLLVVLTQNGFLEALEDGTAALVVMGDAVHPDAEGEEERMDSSMLMMDIIFRLQLAFPGRVFYIRGNHDSFSEDISKCGVPQALLWEQALHEDRGAAYLRAMGRLYEVLPYVILSEHVLACHAGPPSTKVTRDMLVNIRQDPKLQRELTHVRLQKPSSPSGYSRRDVKRFLKCLELDPETPFLVGHTPLSPDDTMWLDAGGIPHHHVVFGSHQDWVGVIALVGGRLIPMRYPVEPLHRVYNRLAAAADEPEA